jgi:propionyl-CoA carboxylase alpha chain
VLGDKRGRVSTWATGLDPAPQPEVVEAPSPLQMPNTKTAGEQAVALAKAIGYDSAGTVGSWRAGQGFSSRR